jgi:large conductance mechanosensitive channel
MKNLLKEFKAFASGGNLIDLAIGFVIAAAFVKVVEAFADKIIGGLIAAIVGEPNFDGLTFGLNGTDVNYGEFVTALFRAQGQRECPWCREFVAVDAVKCKWCTSDLPAVIDGDEAAEERISHTH